MIAAFVLECSFALAIVLCFRSRGVKRGMLDRDLLAFVLQSHPHYKVQSARRELFC